MEKLNAELEQHNAKLSNGMLVEEVVRGHPDFDGFAKDFSDAGFKFLMKGIMEVVLDFDLDPIKRRYAEKWASSPNKTPGAQSLEDKYVRDLNSEAGDDDKD